MAFALLDPREWVLYVLSLVDSLHLFELVLALPVLLPAARLHSCLCIFLSETKPSAHMALHNDVNNTKRTYILLFLCSRDSLPGHGFPTRLHAFSSVLFPMHADPPYCAFILIVRVLLYVPVPQTPAHSVSSGQSPQSFQMQSTKYQF